MSDSLYRKYRPTTFADLAGQEHVKTTLRNQIATGAVAHAYLFTGPRGVGKTTVARLVARAVNCTADRKLKEPNSKNAGGGPCNECAACKEILGGAALDVFEIDAASQTKVEETRENIIESVRFAPNRLKYKVYIIDEVHMLSASSFNALLKTLEEPPRHALFILATTEIHKVPATIISRCQRFDFRRIPTETIVERLREVSSREKVEVEEGVLVEIARHADGGLRDAESLLGQVLGLVDPADAAKGSRITMEIASLVLPATNAVMLEDFLSALLGRNAAEAVRLVSQGMEQGVDLPHFVEDVISALRDRLMADLSQGHLIPLIERLMEARRQMKSAKIVSLPLELAIVVTCGEIEGGGKAGRPAGPQAQDSKPSISQASLVSTAPHPQDPPTPEASPVPQAPPQSVPQSEPPPLEPVATVLGDVPVLDLEDVRRRWPEVFEQIKSCNATLPMVVQTGELTAVDGDSIEMTFNYAVYAEAINQDKNRRLLEQVFARVLGRPVRVRARHEKKEVEQVVDQLLDAFGGSVA